MLRGDAYVYNEGFVESFIFIVVIRYQVWSIVRTNTLLSDSIPLVRNSDRA